jgi:hypothetical protein
MNNSELINLICGLQNAHIKTDDGIEYYVCSIPIKLQELASGELFQLLDKLVEAEKVIKPLARESHNIFSRTLTSEEWIAGLKWIEKYGDKK